MLSLATYKERHTPTQRVTAELQIKLITGCMKGVHSGHQNNL